MTEILIADDRPLNRQILVTLLEYCGIRTVEACNGDQALELIRSERPDAAILDLVMPGLGGIDVAKQVRAESSLCDMGLILHSAAYKIREGLPAANELNMVVLQKPATPAEVWDAVEQTLKMPLQRPQTGQMRATPTKQVKEGCVSNDFGSRLAALLELSYDVYSQISSMDSPKATLEMFGVGARPLVGATFGAVMLLDGSGDLVREHIAFRGTCAETFNTADGRHSPDVIRQFRQLPRRITCDMTRQTAELIGLISGHRAVTSFIKVPLISTDATTSWLYFANKPGGGDFSEIDQRIAAALGEQMVICYETAQLHEQLRDRAVELTDELAERRRIEQALQQKSEELYQSQKLESVGQLAGGIAHEFNNSLQVIQGYTQFAVETLDESASQYQDLKHVLKASEHAATLVSQLLGFARRKPMQSAVIDLCQWIDRFLDMVRPLIGEHVEIDATLDASQAAIKGDAAMLQQVLLNLCLNARDAMPQGGKLHIAVETIRLDEDSCLPGDLGCHDCVCIRVADTGTGIQPDVLARLFEPFTTTKDVGKGTGLGLATSYGIVKQHGGTIQVDTEVGTGTEFRILLPGVVDEPGDTSRHERVAGSSGEVDVAAKTLVVEGDSRDAESFETGVVSV